MTMTGSPASPAIAISIPFDICAPDWTDDGTHVVVSHARGATSAVFTADKNVISGSLNGAVLMSSLTDQGAAPAPLASFRVPVTSVITNGTDPSVAVVTGDQMVRVRDLGLRVGLTRFRRDAPVSDIDVDPVPRLLAIGTSDGTIRAYPWPGS
jgi:WD40 repeat protein